MANRSVLGETLWVKTGGDMRERNRGETDKQTRQTGET